MKKRHDGFRCKSSSAFHGVSRVGDTLMSLSKIYNRLVNVCSQDSLLDHCVVSFRKKRLIRYLFDFFNYRPV